MDNVIMNWKTFVESGRAFFDANIGSPLFQLIELLDDLYRVTYRTPPFPDIGKESDDFFHMCYLLCHRALLSAATVAGSGCPEDGPAITRRALEAAKVALAVKADPNNFEVWKATKVRRRRWDARARDQAPNRRVAFQYNRIATEPLYADLQAVIGALSDFAVHLTPEHVACYEWEWEQTCLPGQKPVISFGVDQDAVSMELLMIAGNHRLIMHVFNRCFDGNLLDGGEAVSIANKTLTFYKDLLGKQGYTEEARTAGEYW
jgi:hypothetical protein